MPSRPSAFRPRRRRLRTAFAAAALAVLTLLFAWKRPDEALRVATASSSLKLCADVFVEGIEAQRAYEANLNVIETSRAMEQRTLDLLKR